MAELVDLMALDQLQATVDLPQVQELLVELVVMLVQEVLVTVELAQALELEEELAVD